MGGDHPRCSQPALARDTEQAWSTSVCNVFVTFFADRVFRQVADPSQYGSHDFRRGHAKDLQKAKHPLATICAMGQWKQGAGSVTAYLDQCELEQDVALEAAIMSEDEEWVD